MHFLRGCLPQTDCFQASDHQRRPADCIKVHCRLHYRCIHPLLPPKEILSRLLMMVELTMYISRAHQDFQSHFRKTLCPRTSDWQQSGPDIPISRSTAQGWRYLFPRCGHLQHGKHPVAFPKPLQNDVAQHASRPSCLTQDRTNMSGYRANTRKATTASCTSTFSRT